MAEGEAEAEAEAEAAPTGPALGYNFLTFTGELCTQHVSI